MNSMLSRSVRILYCCLILVLAAAQPLFAVVINFGGAPTGTVVAGEKPDGGTAPGTLFAPLILSVINNGGGPQSLIIFDSSNPTGDDWDLGTPNETFGGPGIGFGGEAGRPGENNTSYGKLLIVAENIIDNNGDGLVDNPDDEEGGGAIQFIDFSEPVIVKDIVLVDIDYDEWATFECYRDMDLVGTTYALPLGNNSVQIVNLESHGIITSIVITVSSSAAIAQIEYQGHVGVEPSTWGGIKSLFIQ